VTAPPTILIMKYINPTFTSPPIERREIENRYIEKETITNLLTNFKNANEECLDKIKQADEENVKSVVTDGKTSLEICYFLSN
jgi:hypothetical protein